MSDSWKCAACGAANAASMSVCVFCGAGTVAAENFGGHTAAGWGTATVDRPVPPPARPPVDEPTAAYRPVIPVRRRTGWLPRLALLAVIGAAVFLTRPFWVGTLHRLDPSQDSMQTPAVPTSGILPSNPPCPAAVADTIPSGGGAGATLVETHQTSGFAITICDSFGHLFYYGVSRTAPILAITLPAAKSGAEFTATNHAFTYHVGPQGLVVTENGNVVIDQAFVS